jgi:meiotic recombination protein SPO11
MTNQMINANQGKGYPDLATRHFLHVLCECSPELPVYGIADSDPYGLSIMHSYEVGSRNSISNGEKYECRRLQFIGTNIIDFRDECLPFSKTDWQLANSTINKEWILQPKFAYWKQQLQMQMFLGKKAEMNAIGHQSEVSHIASHIQNLIEYQRKNRD